MEPLIGRSFIWEQYRAGVKDEYKKFKICYFAFWRNIYYLRNLNENYFDNDNVQGIVSLLLTKLENSGLFSPEFSNSVDKSSRKSLLLYILYYYTY